MLAAIIRFINLLSSALSLLIIAKVVMSYFMDQYHPVRVAVDRIVNPILNPIRRMLPQTGILDFSPIVAILLIQILEYILVRVLISLAGS
jgi:YggT family protein